MIALHETNLWALLDGVAGTARTAQLFEALTLDSRLLQPRHPEVTRGELAQALAMLLFENVTNAVPMARAYVRDAIREGRKLTFDHGALRTVAAASGMLPNGHLAFARILEPLGYQVAGVYPLDRLGMTGRAYAHVDLPESIAQYFVSELHPERFSPDFQAAVQRVVSSSHDPLPQRALDLLATLAQAGTLPLRSAIRLLPNLVACFARHHAEPNWNDYQLLLRESAEMAWIATEGNAFNHATDRVADVAVVAEQQRRRGRPIKEALEVSGSGRVIQTAFRAAQVERLFVDADGSLRSAMVPGSFHEFITRKEEAPGRLDLRFDSSNAQAIFRMTANGGDGAAVRASA